MTMDDIPLWLLFFASILLIVGTIELGYLFGRAARRRSENEKESPVSAIAGTVLALLAFILAFTFGIVADRYDARRELVRDQADAIHTAYLTADFLPEPGRTTSKELLNTYVAILVQAAGSGHLANNPEAIAQMKEIQTQLWDIAAAHVQGGDTSDTASFYAESLTEMDAVLATRIAVSVQSRLPAGLWVVLYVLVGLAMVAVGYQTAIAESSRTWAMIVLALSFSIVIILIAALDDPERGYIPISQQPMSDLQAEMST